MFPPNRSALRRIHKSGTGQGFLRAVAALLFIAACAYMGAALFGKLHRELEMETVRRISFYDSLSLRGVAVREEQSVCPSAPAELLARDGSRLPAGGAFARETGGEALLCPCSAIFFSDTDGFEALNPAMLEGLSPDRVEELLSARAEERSGAIGRLVTGRGWYFAAVAETAGTLPEKGRCSLLFDGMDQSVPAELLSVSRDGSRAALLLRLTLEGREFLSLRKTGAELIFSSYTGLRLPPGSVREDGEGNEYVYTLSAGTIRQREVEIIYKSGDFWLAALSAGAESLREGETLIVSGENLSEGEVAEP